MSTYEWITEGLAGVWSSTEALLEFCSEADLDRPSPCPGWSVRDVYSHLIGFELFGQGQGTPRFTDTFSPHVKNSVGEMNEAFVAARRSYSVADLRSEFLDVTGESLRRLRALSEEKWMEVGWSPEGEVPYHRYQETRLFDSWIHLQDIRDALLMPADDHGTGEEVVINRCESAIPYIFGKLVRAPEAATLRIYLSGRLAREICVRIENGRAAAQTSLGDTPSLEVTTPAALFWRRVAGRISAEAFLASTAVHVEGSAELARKFAENMAVII